MRIYARIHAFEDENDLWTIAVGLSSLVMRQVNCRDGLVETNAEI
jgi:hypothetical protein